MNPLGIYIHIPFCKSKCRYCDFCSYVGVLEKHGGAYVKALCSQIIDVSQQCEDRTVDTIYIGGGTPTVLTAQEIGSIISTVRSSFDCTHDAEISCESNPVSAYDGYYEELRCAGVNRLSIGAQSMNDKELSLLGRTHTSEQFERSFMSARAAGFDNINVDLMFGIPTQTEKTLYESTEKVLSLSPQHISVYGLKIEQGTPFYKNRDKLALPDEDTEYTMYKEVCQNLARTGKRQYEISNFCEPSYECQHNLKYWNTDEYLGFGTSAHSYFDNHRWEIPRGIEDFIKGDYKIEKQFIGEKERIAEYVMLRMRLCKGVDYREFKNRFNLEFCDLYGQLFKKYVSGGFVILDECSCRFTENGFCVSNTILSDVLEFNN